MVLVEYFLPVGISAVTFTSCLGMGAERLFWNEPEGSEVEPSGRVGSDQAFQSSSLAAQVG